MNFSAATCRYFLALPLLLMCAGCATSTESRRFASSRVLPCAPAEVSVSNAVSPGLSSRFYWDAECRGATFHCTGIADGRGDTHSISCKVRAAGTP